MPQQARLTDSLVQIVSANAELHLHLLAEHVKAGGEIPQHLHDAIVDAAEEFAVAKGDKPKPGVA